MNVFGRIVDEHVEDYPLKVSYFQKPGGSFEQMNDVNPKPSQHIDVYILFEESFSAQGVHYRCASKGTILQ